MKYYPVSLNIKNKNCLVVGGGPVGARKALVLEKCGGKVKVVSEKFSKEFQKIKKSIKLSTKKYEKNDIKGAYLVFAATDNAMLNRKIKIHARENNTLCNIADSPDHSDFILPSIVNRGDLMITISTSGSSPALAKKIRLDLEKQFGTEYAIFLTMMGQIRKKLLSAKHEPWEHRKIFGTLVEKGLIELIAINDEKKIDSILYEVTGKDYTYKNLVSEEQ